MGSIWAISRSESKILIKHALCRYSELGFLPERGAHLQTSLEKRVRKVKHGAKIMSDTSKYYQNRVEYIKM